ADGIIPFVATSPFRSFLTDPSSYQAHKNPEDALVPANRAWHEQNGTYRFAYGLGAVIVLYGVMLCLHPWLPQVAALGSFLVLIMSVVTLSFLITTPECWVPPLGDVNHGFPFLERRGAFGDQGRRHDGRGAGHNVGFGECLSSHTKAIMSQIVSYQVIVLGGGKGGKTLAIELGQKGVKTALIERS